MPRATSCPRASLSQRPLKRCQATLVLVITVTLQEGRPALQPSQPPLPEEEWGARRPPPGAQTRPFAGGKGAPGGGRRAPASGYCDFCLGDSGQNKKTGAGPEELIGQAEDCLLSDVRLSWCQKSDCHGV